MNTNLKNILINIINFINKYKKYFLYFLFIFFVSISVINYIKSRPSDNIVIEKNYQKINLQSDINILECKLQQRICYYNNITNTLESTVENCKSFEYCDSLK